MKNGIGIYRRNVVRNKFVNVPDKFMPVIRTQRGTEIYYRWTWWGIFDRKLKTVWHTGYKDWEIR